MSLRSVRIRRFKNIRDAEVPLGRLTLLVGPNNAGKSSVLQAVQFAVSVAQSLKLDGTAKNRNGITSGTLSTQQLVYTPLRDVYALSKDRGLTQDAATAIEVTFNFDDEKSCSIEVRKGKNKNIAIGISSYAGYRRISGLEQPFSVVAPGLAGIPAFEEFRAPGIVRRAAARGDANSVFRNILWTLKQDPREWDEFCRNLAKIFSNFRVDVRYHEDSDEHIDAFVVKEGRELPIDSCGTGVLQAVQTLAYIGVYKPRLLILDEPDSHLHPDNQRKLARLLGELAEERDFQVLISTHSRHFLDEFSSLDALIHWFSGGGIEDGDLDRVSVLLGLGALDAGDRLRNGQVPLVVITEDSDTSYLSVLLEASGWNRDSVSIWSYKGASSVESAQLLGRFILDAAPGTRVIIHRDRDYLTDDEVADYVDKVTSPGTYAFVTDGTDLESHFLARDHLKNVLPSLDDAEIESLIVECVEATKEKSIAKYINARVEAANRRRNRTGLRVPSAGEISAEAHALFAENPDRYRHGKTTLKALRQAVHQKTGSNANLVVPSDALRVSWIADLKNSGDGSSV